VGGRSQREPPPSHVVRIGADFHEAGRNGFRAAVSVVLSIASSSASGAMVGGSVRFSDIMTEN
jgi:hypothetical protein